MHKKPALGTQERRFFDKTSKVEMYYMLEDYAIRIIGEQQACSNPELILQELTN